MVLCFECCFCIRFYTQSCLTGCCTIISENFHSTSHPTGYETGVCKGSFFDFCEFVFYRFKKKRIPSITSFNYSEIRSTSLPVFTEGRARKFTVSFAFCVHVDVIKYRETVTFFFKRAQITGAFALSAREIVNLQVNHQRKVPVFLLK